MAVPEETRDQHEKLKLFIVCINTKLEDLNLTIKKALDEESRYNKRVGEGNQAFLNSSYKPIKKLIKKKYLMPEYWTGLVLRQLALVPFPDSLYFGSCLKPELENPKPKAV